MEDNVEKDKIETFRKAVCVDRTNFYFILRFTPAVRNLPDTATILWEETLAAVLHFKFPTVVNSIK